MGNIRIEVRSKRDAYSIEIDKKVSIITGMSGVGKTSFTNGILNQSGAYKVDVRPSIYTPYVVQGSAWEFDLRSRIEDSSKGLNRYIFIFDDSDCVVSSEFSSLFGKDECNYYIIINRFEGIGSKGLIGFPEVEFSAYEFKTDGVSHWIEELNKNMNNTDKEIDTERMVMSMRKNLASKMVLFVFALVVFAVLYRWGLAWDIISWIVAECAVIFVLMLAVMYVMGLAYSILRLGFKKGIKEFTPWAYVKLVFQVMTEK